MDEVFASPEGAALIDTVEDPARGGTLRTGREPAPVRRRSALAVRRPPPHARASTRDRRSWTDERPPIGGPRRWRPARSPSRSSTQPPSLPGASPPSCSARGPGRHRHDRSPTPTTVRALEALPATGHRARRRRGRRRHVAAPRRRAPVASPGSISRRTCSRSSSRPPAPPGSMPGRCRAAGPTTKRPAPPADVVVSGHTVYNAPDLEPFVSALDDARADGGSCSKLTERHPLAWMHDLWRRFHDLDIPDAPSIDLTPWRCSQAIGIDGVARGPARSRRRPGGPAASTRPRRPSPSIRTRLCLPARPRRRSSPKRSATVCGSVTGCGPPARPRAPWSRSGGTPTTTSRHDGGHGADRHRADRSIGPPVTVGDIHVEARGRALAAGSSKRSVGIVFDEAGQLLRRRPGDRPVSSTRKCSSPSAIVPVARELGCARPAPARWVRRSGARSWRWRRPSRRPYRRRRRARTRSAS